MTIKTPANLTPPPNSVEPQGDGVKLYRIWERHVSDDGTGEVNLADTVCKLNDPDSGEAINVNIINADGVGVAPIPNFRQTTSQGRKVLFEANFDTGFDTSNDFNCIFDDVLLGESRNASVSGSAGDVAADMQSSSLSLQVVADGNIKDVIVIQSNNYIKIPESGVTYLEGQGVFQDTSSTLNTTSFDLFSVSGIPEPPSISSPNWNIDTFGTGTLNPSKITLDFKKVQTAVFVYSGKSKGDVLFGFLIFDTLYFAHRFQMNNNAPNTKNLNLPIRDQISVNPDNSVVRIFGMYNQLSGYGFGSNMDTVTEPTLVLQQYLNSIVCYSVGADPVDKKRPFVVGNKETYVNVTTDDTPLFSMQLTDTFSGAVNRGVFNFDSLRVSSSSQDANFGYYVKIFYNAQLGGVPNFLPIPGNFQSALEYDLSATSITGGVEIFSAPVMANRDAVFSKEDISKNYRNAFSRSEMEGVNITTKVKQQTLTVVASPMHGLISTDAIDVSANIYGGEVG